MLPCGFGIFIIDFVVRLENPINAQASDEHISICGEADFVLAPRPGFSRNGEETLDDMFGTGILEWKGTLF